MSESLENIQLGVLMAILLATVGLCLRSIGSLRSQCMGRDDPSMEFENRIVVGSPTRSRSRDRHLSP